jgi:mRNA-degrading endonuclease RelE of RelBE toxin-antitoxin system
MIVNKTQEICINPHRYQNLKYPLNNLKRVHIDEHFVLLFFVDEACKIVTLVSFKRHDFAY